MKKHIFFLLLTIVCAFMFASCNSEEFSDIELIRRDEENRIVFYDLDSLEKESDVVVIGTFINDAEQEEKYQYEELFDKKILSYVKSYNVIEVSKVFKGDIKEGDTLTVAQNYGIVEDGLVTDSALTPMIKGDTWIFFLFNNYDTGIYYCTGDSDGRYPVKDFEYARIALTENEDLGVFDEKDFKREIYNEILEKYDFD